MTDTGGPSRGDFTHLSEAVKNLTRTMENLQRMMAETYVRKDVWLESQKNHDLKHATQDEEIDGLTTWKDKVLMTLVTLVITGVVGVLFGTGVVKL